MSSTRYKRLVAILDVMPVSSTEGFALGVQCIQGNYLRGTGDEEAAKAAEHLTRLRIEELGRSRRAQRRSVIVAAQRRSPPRDDVVTGSLEQRVSATACRILARLEGRPYRAV